MTDWSEGYIADIDYTYGYYAELNPLRARLALLSAGYAPPPLGTHCELGFGQGVSINVHAAATESTWFGTDFNPSQAAFAQNLANASGANAMLTDQAFEAFCAQDTLPDFDSIGLHGIWSWISDANRAVIVDFIRRKLKVGGVVYVSYNTLPGWSAFAPMRQLLTQHADLMGSVGEGIVSRIGGALDFADKLLATNPAYVRNNPQVSKKMDHIKGQNKHYLAHEYFNKDWHPMYFSDMADWLRPAKLEFACSANYFDHVDVVNLSSVQQELLKSIADPYFKQSIRDFMVNQQFRKDYWIKGGRKLHGAELTEAIKKEEIIMVAPQSAVKFKVTTSVGEVSLNEAIYQPLVECLSDYKSWSIGQLIQTLSVKKISASQILQAVVVMCGAGYFMPSQGTAAAKKSRTASDKLNAIILAKARISGEIGYLTSPLVAGALSVGRFQQLFIIAHQAKHTNSKEIAAYVWNILSSHGQKMLKDGKVLEDELANLIELERQAKLFIDDQLPLFKALMVV